MWLPSLSQKDLDDQNFSKHLQALHLFLYNEYCKSLLPAKPGTCLKFENEVLAGVASGEVDFSRLAMHQNFFNNSIHDLKNEFSISISQKFKTLESEAKPKLSIVKTHTKQLLAHTSCVNGNSAFPTALDPVTLQSLENSLIEIILNNEPDLLKQSTSEKSTASGRRTRSIKTLSMLLHRSSEKSGAPLESKLINMWIPTQANNSPQETK